MQYQENSSETKITTLLRESVKEQHRSKKVNFSILMPAIELSPEKLLNANQVHQLGGSLEKQQRCKSSE
jgi:hypothetical protein